MLHDKETARQQGAGDGARKISRSLSSSSTTRATAADAAGHTLMRQDHVLGSAESLVTRVSVDGAVCCVFRYLFVP